MLRKTTLVFMVCAFLAITAQPPRSLQESMNEVMWPGLIVDMYCTVDNPFIRVNDIELGNDGITGYNTTLQEMGIDLKDATTVNGFIPRVPTVCVNGSLVPVDNPSVAISLVCRDIVNRISYSTVNLTHFAQILRPENVHMNGDMLTWSPPPRISNFNTTSVQVVVYPVELTYRITITDTLGSKDPEIIRTKQTSFSLSELNIYVQCLSTSRTRCNIRIELRAVIEEHSFEGETAILEMLLHGGGSPTTKVPVDPPSDSSGTVGNKDGDQSENLIIPIVAGIAVVIVIVLVLVGLFLFSAVLIRRAKKKAAVKNSNVLQVVDNDYDIRKPPPPYQPSRASTQAPSAGNQTQEDENLTGVYTTVTTQPHGPIIGGLNNSASNQHHAAARDGRPETTAHLGQPQHGSPPRELNYAEVDVRPTGRVTFNDDGDASRTTGDYVQVNTQN